MNSNNEKGCFNTILAEIVKLLKVISIVLITLKLLHLIDYAWIYVLIPVYISVGLVLIIAIVVAVKTNVDQFNKG